jgi:hypothetical protein
MKFTSSHSVFSKIQFNIIPSLPALSSHILKLTVMKWRHPQRDEQLTLHMASHGRFGRNFPPTDVLFCFRFHDLQFCRESGSSGAAPHDPPSAQWILITLVRNNQS